jgi:hypothetical protein
MLIVRIDLRAAYALCLIAIGLISPAAAAPYTFTKIVDTSIDPNVRTNVGLAMDRSTIAISTGEELLTFSNGIRTDIIKKGDVTPLGTIRLLDPLRKVTMIDGKIAFIAQLTDSRSVVYRGTGAELTVVAKDGDTNSAGGLLDIDLLDGAYISGDNVLFTASVRHPGPGIYVGDGSVISTIVQTQDPAPERTFLPLSPGRSTIDGNGVAFEAPWGLPYRYGVLTIRDGVFTTIARQGDLTDAGPLYRTSLPLLSGDTVAFHAGTETNSSGIFTGNGGPLTTIVKVGDPGPSGSIVQLILGGVANNGHDVLYYAGTPGGSGVYVSSGGVTAPVIERGDVLFGQKLQGFGNRFAFDRSGSGRVAFSYLLEDGTEGVAVATSVPEPAAYVIGIATFLCGAIRRRTRLFG